MDNISPAARMELISLDQVLAGQRRQHWEEMVNTIHPRTSVSVTDEAQFDGWLSWRRIGDVLLSDIRSNAQDVSRENKHIRQDGRHVIQMNVQLTGVVHLSQDGRECTTRPGEIVIYDSSRPYEISIERPSRQLYVEFPLELLRARFGPTEHVTARCIDGASGLGRFLYYYINTLVLQSEEDDALIANRLKDHLVDLLITAFSALPQGAVAPASLCRSMVLHRAKTYVGENLRDESLSPVSVAQVLGVSLRYLYDLFADEDVTIGTWIRQARLERCRADIENPTLSARSLSEIAFSWGFSDSAHFSRAFRNHFGLSPRECRIRKQ